MSYEPRRWALGLIPLGVFWLLGTIGDIGDIEADLTTRGKAALGANFLDNAGLNVAGRDVALAGAAFTPTASQAAFDTELGVFGVRLVDAGAVTLIPEAKPYVWSASRDGAKVALSGSAPDPAARAAAVAAARAIPGAEVVDAMSYKRGETGALAAGSAFALAELAMFAKGSTALSDGALTVTGLAADSASYEKALAALKTLPAGVTLARSDILPPLAKPYVFSATSGASGLKLAGVAPTAASRDAIATAAAADFPGVKIDNALAIASGAPNNFDAAAKFALGAIASVDDGAVELTDKKFKISGAERKLGDIENFIKSVAAVPKGYSIYSNITPVTAHPFEFLAAQAGGVLTLVGETPSKAVRDEIDMAAARAFPTLKIDDQLKLAKGVPPGDFGAAASFALASIAKLDDGKATLTDTDLVISGKARELGAVEALDKSASSLPAGYALIERDIVPADVHPFTFAADKDADGGLRLTGFVPSMAARQALEAAAAIAGGKPAIDETIVAGGLPAGVNFGAATQFALAQLARLISGEAKLSDASFSIAGKAADAATGVKADAALASLPAGMKLAGASIERPSASTAMNSLDDVAAAAAAAAAAGPKLDAPACDAGFKDSLNGATIEFDTGKATISKTSYELIVKLAGVALRCEVANIQVAGYTDNQGDAGFNDKLSKERADTVASVLQKAGVPADRLAAVGYGAASPVASNDTEEGRAKNRRIEFSVK